MHNPKVMTLESIETIAVRAGQIESAFVRIETNTDLIGWGEVQAPRTAMAACELVHSLFKPALEGAEFDGGTRGIALLGERMVRRIKGQGYSAESVAEAMSGCELALWDLAGKASGKPIARLIAGRDARSEVTAYVAQASLPVSNAVRVRLDRCGLAEGLRIARRALDSGARVTIETGASLGPLAAAAIQFAAALPQGTLVELSAGEGGKRAVPQLPGLGIEIDEPELRLMELRSR